MNEVEFFGEKKIRGFTICLMDGFEECEMDAMELGDFLGVEYGFSSL